MSSSFSLRCANTSFLPAIAVLAGAMLLAGAAHAHSPRLKCQADGQHVTCEGGFSDGSSASGIGISVVSYDDKPLWTGKLDAQSRVRFERPRQDFYVRFEGGDGHSLEVDHGDIR